MTAPRCRLDHLVVTAPELDRGSREVEAVLGVPLQPGGEHPLMGTHNRLLRLGDSAYLEVLAPNPAAAAPDRPRWFGLDALPAVAPSRLSAWVAGTREMAWAAAAAGPELGAAEPMSRGDLRWRLTIPPGGMLPLGGTAPHLIEWEGDAHPSARLPRSGCELVALELRHPDPDRLRALLDRIGFAGPVRFVSLPPGAAPGLRAVVATPRGERVLEGR